MTGSAPLVWLILLRDLSVKGALLLLAAWALTFAMRQAPAAARHLVWLLTFAGLLLLPLLSVTLPALSVLVLPPPAAPVVLSSPAGPPVTIASMPDVVTARQPAPSPPARTFPAHALHPASPDWPSLLCLLWLLGVALAALPLAAGWTLAARRLRRCFPVTDPTTLALAAEAGRQLGLRRPISLRFGPSVSVPVTFGLVRPVILLPDGAASWPAERLRVALLHELAHVKRGDWATQTAARLVCALFWHIPLVWPAARMLRAEAERACDDLVLSSGIPAPDYAQHLLAVAAALSGANRPLPLAVPMAGRGPLESRLRAVLSSRPRRALSRPRAACAFVLALVVLVPLAVLRPAARAAHQAATTLPLAPVVSLTPPEAARHLPAPVKAAIAAPPAPTQAQSTPIGVPPMKTSIPVKTVALAALTASLALPAAQSKPTTPVKHAPGPKLAGTQQIDAVMRDLTQRIYIMGGRKRDVVSVLKRLFYDSHKSYVIEPGVSGSVDVKLNGVPFDTALTALVEANSQPLEWSVQEGVYRVRPRTAVVDRKAADAAPRQVQLKFEWVSSVSASGAAPDKSVDALTIIAEEGRKAQVSSQHLWNGAGGGETISVLAHLESGGVVVLDITEHSDSTARVGDTKSDATETTVRVKDGETGTVRLQVSKQSGQGAERALFVTPTIVGAGGG